VRSTFGRREQHFLNFPLFFSWPGKPENKQKEQTAVVLSDLRLTPELRRLPNWNSFTRDKEIWEGRENRRCGRGGKIGDVGGDEK